MNLNLAKSINISARNLLGLFFLSIIIFACNEYIFKMYIPSVILSLIFLAVFFYLALKKISDAIFYLFFLNFAFFTRPRDLHLIGVFERGDYAYYSPNFLKFFSISLTTWMVFLLVPFILLRLKQLSIRKITLPVFIFLVIVANGILGLFLNDQIDLRSILTDLKFPLALITGFMVISVVTDKDRFISQFFQLALYYLILMGFTSFFAFFLDFISGNFLLKFNENVLLCISLIPVLFLFKQRNKLFLLLPILMLACLPITRGSQLGLMLIFFICFYIAILYERKSLPIFLVAAFLSIPLFSIIISQNYYLEGFVTREAANFTDKSTLIRLAEFNSILALNDLRDFFYLFFGRGFGSYVLFDPLIINTELVLTLTDFSQDEIVSGTMIKPHTFIAYYLMKYGIVGVFIFIGLHLYLLFTKNYNLFLLNLGLSYFIMWNSYWMPMVAFLFGILLSLNFFEKIEKKGMTA